MGLQIAVGADDPDERPHLRQLILPLAVEQVGRAGEGGAVGEKQRLGQTVKIGEADLRHDAPAKAGLHHGDTGRQAVHIQGTGRLETVLHQPAGFHAHVFGVGVPADVPHLIQRGVGVGSAPDQADRLPLQQDLAVGPVVLAPDDGEIGLPFLQLAHTVAAVVAGHFQGDVRILRRIVGKDLGQAVVGVVEGGFHPQGAAYDALVELDAAAERFQFRHRFLDALPGVLARRGQGHAVFAAQEQRRAQLRLHILQPLAESRLGEIELFGCAGQISGLRQRQKDQKIFFVHGLFRPFHAFLSV